MPNYPKYNLTGKTAAVTYPHLIQHCVESASFVDGLGTEISTSVNISASVYGTSSWSNNSVSASWAPDQTVTVNSASWASSSLNSATSSWANRATVATSASWASHSLSASWAPFTDTGTTLYTGSTYEITASTANKAISASWAPDQTVTVNSASWASASISASYAPFTQVEQISASWSSASISASYAPDRFPDIIDESGIVTIISYQPQIVYTGSVQLELVNPAPGDNPNVPAGTISFRCNEWTASTVPRTVVRLQAQRDPVTPDGGVSGQFSINLEQGAGGVYEFVRISGREGNIYLSGSVYNGPDTNNGKTGFYGQLHGYADNATASLSSVSSSWASASLSASISNKLTETIYQNLILYGDSVLQAIDVNNAFGAAAGFSQFGANVPDTFRSVVYINRNYINSPYHTEPLLYVVNQQTASSAKLIKATQYDSSNVEQTVFTVGAKGDITASGLFATASNAVSASWAPTSITYPLTVLPVNDVSYSIDFGVGQYFQLDTTGSEFTFGTSSNMVAVRNASIYITAQSGSRTLVFNPSWIVMGNFPTTIAHNSASVLSLTTFGSNDATVVAAFASKS